MKTIYTIAVAMTSALALSSPANAGFFDFTLTPFIGANLGQSSIDVSCPAASSCDDTDTTWKIYGGLEVNEFIAMEIGYINLGEAKMTGATVGTAKASGMTLGLVGTYEVTPTFTLLARGGMNFLTLDVNETTGATVSKNSDTDVAWSLGVGGQFNLSKSVGLRMEFERFFNVGDAHTWGEPDVDLVSAGLVFKF